MNNFWEEDPSRRRCRADDVDPDWWMERDLSEFEVNTSRGYSSEYGKALVEGRDDNIRAQILCYQCPLLFACREAAWDEPAHVWGGLTARDRYNLRTTGAMLEVVQEDYDPPNVGGSSEQVGTLFLNGDKTDAIAATLHLSEGTVRFHIKNLLGQMRELRERGIREWEQPSVPPAMTRESHARYRAAQRLNGRESSQSSHRASA